MQAEIARLHDEKRQAESRKRVAEEARQGMAVETPQQQITNYILNNHQHQHAAPIQILNAPTQVLQSVMQDLRNQSINVDMQKITQYVSNHYNLLAKIAVSRNQTIEQTVNQLVMHFAGEGVERGSPVDPDLRG